MSAVLCHKVLGAQHPDMLRSMVHNVVMYMTQGGLNEGQDVRYRISYCSKIYMHSIYIFTIDIIYILYILLNEWI